MENRISHNALMALFHHFVYKVLKKNVSAQQQEFGLHAAGLYFLLLEVPGMHVWCDGAGLLFVICLLGFELLYQCFVLTGRLGDSESMKHMVCHRCSESSPVFL